MSTKIAFSLFLLGCAFLALVNADRNYPSRLNYNVGQFQHVERGRKLANPHTRTVEIPTAPCPCPCPDDDVYGAASRRRHMSGPAYRGTIETPSGQCECPCADGGLPGDAGGNEGNKISAHEKVKRQPASKL